MRVQSDIQLVKASLRGDQHAFAVLVERHQQFVYSMALKMLKDSREAEEIAQDVFVKAYRGLSSFSGRSKFTTWLYSIAYRTVVSRWRVLRLYSNSLDTLDEERTPGLEEKAADDELLQTDRIVVLKQAINQLSSKEAVVISLYYLEEQTVKELTEVTGESASNVKVMLHRARKKLKTILEGAGYTNTLTL